MSFLPDGQTPVFVNIAQGFFQERAGAVDGNSAYTNVDIKNVTGIRFTKQNKVEENRQFVESAFLINSVQSYASSKAAIDNIAEVFFNKKQISDLIPLIRAKKLEANINKVLFKKINNVLPTDRYEGIQASMQNEMSEIENNLDTIQDFVTSYNNSIAALGEEPDQQLFDRMSKLTGYSKSFLRKCQRSMRLTMLSNEMIHTLQTGELKEPAIRADITRASGHFRSQYSADNHPPIADDIPTPYTIPNLDPRVFQHLSNQVQVENPIDKLFCTIYKMSNYFTVAAGRAKYANEFPLFQERNFLTQLNGRPEDTFMDVAAGGGMFACQGIHGRNFEKSFGSFDNYAKLPMFSSILKSHMEDPTYSQAKVPLMLSHIICSIDTRNGEPLSPYNRVVGDELDNYNNIYLLEKRIRNSEYATDRRYVHQGMYLDDGDSGTHKIKKAKSVDEGILDNLVNEAKDASSVKLERLKALIEDYIANAETSDRIVRALKLADESFEYSAKNLTTKILKFYIKLLKAAKTGNPRALSMLSFLTLASSDRTCQRTLFQIIRSRFLKMSMLEAVNGEAVRADHEDIEHENARLNTVLSRRGVVAGLDDHILSRQYIFNMDDDRWIPGDLQVRRDADVNAAGENFTDPLLSMETSGFGKSVTTKAYTNFYKFPADWFGVCHPVDPDAYAHGAEPGLESMRSQPSQRLLDPVDEESREGVVGSVNRLVDQAGMYRGHGYFRNEFTRRRQYGNDASEEINSIVITNSANQTVSQDIRTAILNLEKFEFFDSIILTGHRAKTRTKRSIGSDAPTTVKIDEWWKNIVYTPAVADIYGNLLPGTPGVGSAISLEGPESVQQDLNLLQATGTSLLEGGDENFDIITFAAALCVDIEKKVRDKALETGASSPIYSRNAQQIYKSIDPTKAMYRSKTEKDDLIVPGASPPNAYNSKQAAISAHVEKNSLYAGRGYSYGIQRPSVAPNDRSNRSHGSTYETPAVFMTEILKILGEFVKVLPAYSDSAEMENFSHSFPRDLSSAALQSSPGYYENSELTENEIESKLRAKFRTSWNRGDGTNNPYAAFSTQGSTQFDDFSRYHEEYKQTEREVGRTNANNYYMMSHNGGYGLADTFPPDHPEVLAERDRIITEHANTILAYENNNFTSKTRAGLYLRRILDSKGVEDLDTRAQRTINPREARGRLLADIGSSFTAANGRNEEWRPFIGDMNERGSNRNRGGLFQRSFVNAGDRYGFDGNNWETSAPWEDFEGAVVGDLVYEDLVAYFFHDLDLHYEPTDINKVLNVLSPLIEAFEKDDLRSAIGKNAGDESHFIKSSGGQLIASNIITRAPEVRIGTPNQIIRYLELMAKDPVVEMSQIAIRELNNYKNSLDFFVNTHDQIRNFDPQSDNNSAIATIAQDPLYSKAMNIHSIYAINNIRERVNFFKNLSNNLISTLPNEIYSLLENFIKKLNSEMGDVENNEKDSLIITKLKISGAELSKYVTSVSTRDIKPDALAIMNRCFEVLVDPRYILGSENMAVPGIDFLRQNPAEHLNFLNHESKFFYFDYSIVPTRIRLTNENLADAYRSYYDAFQKNQLESGTDMTFLFDFNQYLDYLMAYDIETNANVKIIDMIDKLLERIIFMSVDDPNNITEDENRAIEWYEQNVKEAYLSLVYDKLSTILLTEITGVSSENGSRFKNTRRQSVRSFIRDGLSIVRGNLELEDLDPLFVNVDGDLKLASASDLWNLTKPTLVRETEARQFFEPRKFSELEIELVIMLYNSYFSFRGSLKENIFNGSLEDIVVTSFTNSVMPYRKDVRQFQDPSEVTNYTRDLFRINASQDLFLQENNPQHVDAATDGALAEQQSRVSQAMSNILQRISVVRHYKTINPLPLSAGISAKLEFAALDYEGL